MKKIKQKFGKAIRKIKNIGTLNLVLIFVGIYMVYINWKMLAVYVECGSAPESAWCALIGALIGEAGICGWIRTNKDKCQDRKWQKEDEKEQDNPDINVGDNEEEEENL